MERSLRLMLAVAGLSVILLSPQAVAQSNSYKAFCQTIGTAPLEPLGDREGHALSVSQYTCRVEGGPLDGGIWTGTNIYEWDKGNAVGISAHGVGRKSGATLVYQLGEFNSVLTLSNGKVTGFVASGKGTYKFASGAAASLAGRSFSYTARPTGSGQFVLEGTTE